MKVICHTHIRGQFTIDKWYEVIAESTSGRYYKVKDNNGIGEWTRSDNFYTTNQYRSIKLNDILSD